MSRFCKTNCNDTFLFPGLQIICLIIFADTGGSPISDQSKENKENQGTLGLESQNMK